MILTAEQVDAAHQSFTAPHMELGRDFVALELLLNLVPLPTVEYEPRCPLSK